MPAQHAVQPDLGAGSAVAMAHVVFDQAGAQRHGARGLQARIQGRVDLVPGRIDGIPVLVLHVVAHHFGQIRRVDLDRGAVQARFHRTRLGLIVLRLADVTELEHSAKNMGAAHLCGFGIGDRIDRGGGGRDAGQRRHFGEVQLIQALAEIHLGRGANAVRPLAQEDLIDVQGENLLLGKLGLHEQGYVDLAHFPLHVAARGQEHVPRYLHGDGAGALADAAGLQIGHRRPQIPCQSTP